MGEDAESRKEMVEKFLRNNNYIIDDIYYEDENTPAFIIGGGKFFIFIIENELDLYVDVGTQHIESLEFLNKLNELKDFGFTINPKDVIYLKIDEEKVKLGNEAYNELLSEIEVEIWDKYEMRRFFEEVPLEECYYC